MKKGALFVESLVALLIIAMSIGIAYVPTWKLLKKSLENRYLIELSDILLNEAETLTYKDASTISSGTFKKTYNNKEYTIQITKKTESLKDKITMVSTKPGIIFSDIVVITIRVIAPDGKYIETQVVPQQW
ncbi:MAG: hypothetical protein H0Z24_06310 [Thermosipho sp. (in: Bacteria)]|nr:hypothetical protein [Thermosipho sp. (in: thermotogales)]